jgi:hypothetical protein
MSDRTDNEQIGTNPIDQVHKHANRMAAHDGDLYVYAALLGQKARALDYRTEAERGDSLGFSHFLDVLRHSRDFLHANQMKHRGVLSGHCNRQFERFDSRFRPIIGMQDSLEHRKPPLFGLV